MTKLRVWVLCFPYFMNNYDFKILNQKNKINNLFVQYRFYFLFEKIF
jgi:hypothetical protein